MTEQDFLLKIAETKFQIANEMFWSDLIKVGFPSVVAGLAAFFAYITNVKNSAQKIASEIKLQNQEIEHDKQKNIHETEMKLIREITVHLTAIHESQDAYISDYRGRSFSNERDGYTNDYKDNLVSELYETCNITRSENLTKLDGLIHLLGNEEIIKKHDEFTQKSLSLIADFCSAHEPKSVTDINSYCNEYEPIVKSLFKLLSNMYLSK